MFFEKPEIKILKELHSLVRNFAYKKFMESKKTTKLHTVLSRKVNDKLIIEEETSETGFGLVDKFVSIATLRKKLESVKSEIQSKMWSSACLHVWGNELYNRAVNIQNPFFENLFLPIMEKLTKEDRKRGSMYIVKAVKAQINAMKLSMNRDYLVFMNITLLNEVIRKFISPQCS